MPEPSPPPGRAARPGARWLLLSALVLVVLGGGLVLLQGRPSAGPIGPSSPSPTAPPPARATGIPAARAGNGTSPTLREDGQTPSPLPLASTPSPAGARPSPAVLDRSTPPSAGTRPAGATALPTPGAPASSSPVVAPPTSTPATTFSPAATLDTLAQTRMPTRDLYTLTAQLKVRTGVFPPTRAATPPRPLRLGAQDVFAVGDTAAGTYYTTTATLRAATAHGYWWVGTDATADVDLATLRQTADHFERQIDPTDRRVFGDPPATGVDNDPHVNILYVPLTGEAGYFSSADMYPRAVNPYSNQRKMIYLDPLLQGAEAEGVLAHEFQHLIHWQAHPNQASWLNEGMAELAAQINGYPDTGPVEALQETPNTQLNAWASPADDPVVAHYGAAYLFLKYLYDHFGAAAIQAVIQAPGTDLDAIDGALAQLGRPERFPTLFTQWALDNWIGPTRLTGRGTAARLTGPVQPRATLSKLPTVYTGTVQQQAADYLVLPAGTVRAGRTLTFTGALTVPLLGTAPHSGHGLWWSNRGDDSMSSLTRAFDLRGVRSATLTYWTWYDLEDGFDYAYTEVSTDGGQTWATLAGGGTTAANPNGTNLGHGYTGASGGGATPTWVQERRDLGAYADQPILLRFQYVTDDAYNRQGFAVDDLAIPEIGFRDDMEAPDPGGWTADGFVHVDPVLPEQWVVAVISYASPGTPTVTMLPLDSTNRGQLALGPLDRSGSPLVILVAPLAPVTIQPGHYQLTIK